MKGDIKKHPFEPKKNNIIRVRDTARWRLTNIGPAVVPRLVHQLKTDTVPRRQEAAQILGEIHDESVVDDLVEALLDDSNGVERAASEALIKYGRNAILPLLEGITRHFDSERFRRGAFHVLHTLGQTHQLGPKIQEVLIILRSM